MPLIDFSYNNSYHASIQMAPFDALYGKTYRLPIGLFEVGVAALLGLYVVLKATEKVLKIAQSLQKSYADVRRRYLEFKVCDFIYLKVSPMKGVKRFGKKRKLRPH